MLKIKNYELYHGKMEEVLTTFQDNSIDCIVCDPPYELNFMNKGWDNSGVAFRKETWEHCFRVLKDGGYLIAFGGTRTYHRIACAIEDAGFEIRDSINWVYGCLSEDTEILTQNGWKNLSTIKINDDIYSLDLHKNKIQKNKVKNVFKYDYDGEMVNLKNQNTDQLLTPNHHCIVKDIVRTRIKSETKYHKHTHWFYKDAWQIRSQYTILPLASDYNGSWNIGNNIFCELLGLIISEGWYHKDTNAISISQSSANKEYVSRIRYILGKLKINYSEYQRKRKYKDRYYTEYEFYIGEKSIDFVNKIKEICPNKKLHWGMLELSLDNKKSLIKGLLEGDGVKKNKNTKDFSSFYQKDKEELEIFQVLLHLTSNQGWINNKKYCCGIHHNSTTEIQRKNTKNRFVNYNGIVWCIETEVGNFMARRNGKIFITGNSGFPKSMNISKGLEAKEKLGNAGTRNKRIIEQSCEGESYSLKQTNNGAMGEIIETTRKDYVAGTDLAKKWYGYGTTMKPAYEPIIVARKPFKSSLVDNVLKNGL